jgi:hypothetical protein
LEKARRVGWERGEAPEVGEGEKEGEMKEGDEEDNNKEKTTRFTKPFPTTTLALSPLTQVPT